MWWVEFESVLCAFGVWCDVLPLGYVLICGYHRGMIVFGMGCDVFRLGYGVFGLCGVC